MSRRLTRLQLALLAIVCAGAALRFATLDLQSFWLDEGITVGRLLRNDFGGMLGQIPASEQTPPLYYVLAWLWTRPFGTGEVGVRSLSALVGSGTIPIAYALGRQLVSRRAGLVAAALTAFSPLLVWYSQEARSYALFVALSGLSLLLFLRAIEERRDREARSRALWQWAIAAALALATHWFAVFLLLPQAAWLLLRGAPPRAARLAVGAWAAVGAALLPLAVDQAGGGPQFIHGLSVATRAIQVPKQYLVGYDAPAEVPLTVAAALLAVLALWLAVARTGAAERRGARIAAAFATGAVGVPLLLSIAGFDYLITRNVIGGWLPVALVLAAGLGARRAGVAGPLAAAALCAIGLAAIVAVDTKPEFQRDDWRDAAGALGPATTSRAIVVNPVNGQDVLSVYADGLRRFPARPVAVREIDLLAVDRRRPGQRPRPARPPTPQVPGFRVVERRDATTFTLIRLLAARPLPVTRTSLYLLRLDPHLADEVLQTR
ncbi:MAG: mannosyltransferase [Thermoleophilaceae bacterium]|nr:mannosyltransferase [Thermoleophilaceae bacterium]